MVYLPAIRDTRRFDYLDQTENILDRPKDSRPLKKFLEQISKDQYQFSKGGFVSRLMEWFLGLLCSKN